MTAASQEDNAVSLTASLIRAIRQTRTRHKKIESNQQKKKTSEEHRRSDYIIPKKEADLVTGKGREGRRD